MKLTKRHYLTVVQSEKRESSQGANGPIYTVYQYFVNRAKHKKGSTRPAGWLHGAEYEQRIEVRWLYTERHDFFAPEITFRPTRPGIWLAGRIGKELFRLEYDNTNPETLLESLGAIVVEYVDDRKDDCWNDYRVLRIPGEPAMVTLARAVD